MGKIELSHEDIRMVLEHDADLFKEVKGKILDSAIKNSLRLRLDSSVKDYIDIKCLELLKEEGIALNSRIAKNRMLPNRIEGAAKALIDKYIDDNLKKEIGGLVQTRLKDVEVSVGDEIKRAVDNVEGRLERLLDAKIEHFKEQTINSEVEKRMLNIARRIKDDNDQH